MVVGIDHVGVLVRDSDQALPYDHEQLGPALAEQEDLPNVGVRVVDRAAGRAMRHLAEPTGPGPLRDQLDAHGEGLYQVASACPRCRPRSSALR